MVRAAAEDVIKEVGGVPCVIKLLEGTQGMGVILAETVASAKSIIEAFSAANINILVQEYIKEAGGTDVRALGGWRASCRCDEANRAKSAISAPTCTAAEKLKRQMLSEAETRTAVKAAEILGLNVCGVDMLGRGAALS